jgi:hypothetical protein
MSLLTLAYTTSTYSGQKRLTSTTNVALQVDDVHPTVGQRVLFINSSGARTDAGLWVVTQTGSGAAQWILDRPTDFNTTSHVSYGIGVKVLPGSATYSGSYFMMTTPDPFTLEVTGGSWSVTDKYTVDQYCIKYGDGTVSILSESGYYNTWGA